MRNTKLGGKVALRKRSARPHGAKPLTKRGVFPRMGRLPHCFDFRSVLGCFQNRSTGRGGSMRESDDQIPAEVCDLCEIAMPPSGDNWDGLCPGCADIVSRAGDDLASCNDDLDDLVRQLRLIREGLAPRKSL